MDSSIVLIVLLVGAIVTYLSGNKFAPKIALFSKAILISSGFIVLLF